ncbi:MAG: PASTA domain-containing protein [Oscillospiraceae bacterium]|nr:PASTA domain-containing protein [Oscillospiraceae bacterium]
MANKPSKQLVQRAMAIMLITCVVGFGAGIVGLIRAQIINADEYRQKAEAQQLSDKTISAQRGTIYDKNMNILSQSANVWKVYINPSKIEDEKTRDNISRGLSNILELDYKKVHEKASQSKYGYVSIKTQVENEKKNQISEFISANRGYNQIIGVDPDTKRYYPYAEFASTVLGFTGSDDEGRSGLEYFYNDSLTGVAGRIITARNARQGDMPNQFESTYDPKQGTSLVLTIDQVIQYYLDKGLEQAVRDSKALYGYGIVMDVKTGAILAMSTKPDYDPNEPYDITNGKKLEQIDEITNEEEKKKAMSDARYAQWRNRTISDTYEPGSVFKVVTASAALEENVVSENDGFHCTGSVRIADRIIHCHNRRGHGSETFTQGLMNSCNPVFVNVGQRLGAKKFYKYFEACGFSVTTGVDLPAEAKPVANVTYYTADKLGVSQLASCSFGQSFQVSPIQMINAVAAIGNGGRLMTPYIVGSTLDEEGNTISVNDPKMKRQVVSESTAKRVAKMMEAVSTSGTGKNSYVAGYRVAGKTGTSQKLTNKGKYIASFVGFAPADDPSIAVLIVIDEPTGGSYTGGALAAPVAAQVFEQTLIYLNVEPKYTNEELAQLDVKTPSLVGKSVTDAIKELRAKGFTYKTIGTGKKVVNQTPSYNQILPKNGIVVLYTEEQSETTKTVVPKLIGLTLAQANKAAIDAGVNIKVSGYTSDSDIVSYRQSVAEGTQVAMGTIITVSFKTNANVSDLA